LQFYWCLCYCCHSGIGVNCWNEFNRILKSLLLYGCACLAHVWQKIFVIGKKNLLEFFDK
jgi:hypothetical protein